LPRPAIAGALSRPIADWSGLRSRYYLMFVQPRNKEIDAMNSDPDSPRTEPGRLQGERTRVDLSETIRSDGPKTTT
jgi:hypothetical protein